MTLKDLLDAIASAEDIDVIQYNSDERLVERRVRVTLPVDDYDNSYRELAEYELGKDLLSTPIHSIDIGEIQITLKGKFTR